MYRIEVLPSARRDVEEIVRYIAGELGNPSAAERFLEGFQAAASSLETMPYRRRVYVPLRPLQHEFRAIDVGHYLVFYWIEEEPEQVVTVARVLYGPSDYGSRL